MKKTKAGIKSIGHPQPNNWQPPRVDKHNIFCFAVLADQIKGTIYTDFTGALLARSLDGNQFFFIAYAYDPKYIYAIPIHSGSNDYIIVAFSTSSPSSQTSQKKATEWFSTSLITKWWPQSKFSSQPTHVPGKF